MLVYANKPAHIIFCLTAPLISPLLGLWLLCKTAVLKFNLISQLT